MHFRALFKAINTYYYQTVKAKKKLVDAIYAFRKK